MALQEPTMTDFGLFREDFGNASIGTNLTATTQTVTHANVQPTTNAYTATEYPLVGDGFLESTFTITPSNTNHGVLIYRIDMVNDSFDLLDKSLGFRLTNATVDLIGWASDDTDSQGVIAGLDTDIPFTVTLSGRVQLPLSGMNIDIVQGQNTFNLTANCLGSSDALVEPFGYKLGCFIKTVGEGFDITGFSFSDGEALPLSATFTPNPIVVADDTTSVVLEAFPSDGVAPYFVEWLYDGVTLLSTDNPYTFPTDVSKRGHYVLGRVTDDDSDVVDLQMNIVSDSIYWITEPLDYSGAIGSTMPVDGSVSFSSSVNLTTLSPYALVGCSETHTDDSITVTSLQANYTSAISEEFDFTSLSCNFSLGGVLGDALGEFASAVRFIDSTIGAASSVMIYPRSSQPTGVFVVVGNSNYTITGIDYTLPFDCEFSISDTGVVDITLTQGVSVGTLAANLGQMGVDYRVEFYSAGTQGVLEITNWVLTTNRSTTFIHKDNIGNTVNTLVSTDGIYSVPMLNMQPSNSGTHNLEATQGSSTIYSTFEVLITAIQWDQEPSDVSINEGSATTFNASVAGYSGNVTFELISWYGETIDTQVVQDGVYYFYHTNAQLFETGEWTLRATDSSGAIESNFSVIVSVVEYGVITQGNISTDVNILAECSVSVEVSMESERDSTGVAQWLDNGTEYDNYSNSFVIEALDQQAFEILMTSASSDAYIITSPYDNGFYPFGMGFATQQGYPINLTKVIKGKNVDFFGKSRTYELTSVPSEEDVYTALAASSTIADCGRILNHWTIGGVAFPYGKFTAKTNDKKNTVILGGNSSYIPTPYRDYGDSAKISIQCAEEQARLILQFLTLTMRGTEQTAVFPSIYNIFGRRHSGLTTATVKLHSNIIKIKHVRASIVAIEFEIQMVGL